MDQKQREKWERTRAKGKWRFILLIAAYFCIVLTLTFSIYAYFFSFYGFRFESLYFEIPFNLVLGLIVGFVMWLIAENKYQKSSKI